MIKRYRNQFGIGLLIAIGLALTCWAAPAAPAGAIRTLLQIGKPDGRNAEFALAPKGYNKFTEDGFFVVGASNPGQTWPYVHPGPSDGWAGGRAHTFTILFGLKDAPPAGTCKLTLALLDTQGKTPPRLQIRINDLKLEKALPKGGGDKTVNGAFDKGKKLTIPFAFTASALKAGDNRIEITTTQGSWMLYDAVTLEGPSDLAFAPTSLTLLDGIKAPPVLLRRGDSLVQPVQVAIRHFGPPAEAVIRVGDLATTHAQLALGANLVSVPLQPVETTTTLTVTVGLQGKTLATQAVALKPVRRWTVYILPHSHVDIGYTQLQTVIEQKQMANIETAIEMARASAANPEGERFKWNVEVLWAVESYIKQSPEHERKFIDAVKAGWIGLDAFYANELTGLCRPEELVRLVDFAGRLSKKHGLTIDSAMISDVPGLTWGLTTVLGHAGVKYISDGVNYSDRIGGSRVIWQDRPMYWLSPSGKQKVLFWTPYCGYSTGRLKANMEVELLGRLAELEEQGYPYDVFQMRWNTGDNGPPDTKMVDVVRRWNAKIAWPRLMIATTSQAYHALESRWGAKLPVYRGDFTPYWEDGAASSARETALNRASAERLAQAEALWALLAPARYPAEGFWAAWRDVILYSEHTWGASRSVSEPESEMTKGQWKIKQAFALDAAAQSEKLLAGALAARDKSDGGAAKQAFDVFNTSSWPRTGLVTVPPALSANGDRVLDAEGQPVPAQRLTSGELVILARDVPPLAARRYTVNAGKAAAQGKAFARGATLGNAALSVKLSLATGAVSELRCKGVRANLVDPKSPTALNDYFYLPGGDLKDLVTSGIPKITVKETGPLVASLLVESDAPGCKKLTREVRVVDGQDCIELYNTIDKLPILAKEGVHFGFGFNVPGGQMRLESTLAVVRPDADQIPAACKNWFTVQRWADVSSNACGVTWATVDAPLVEVGGVTANLPHIQSDPAVWRQQVGPTQTLYSWAMNNHWHTNYRASQEGPTLFRYMIRPHVGGYAADAAARFGAECSQPLLAVPAAGEARVQPRLSVGPAGVLVSALKPSNDGKALIVRLLNTTDKALKATVRFADPQPVKVTLSELNERTGAAANGVGGASEVNIPAGDIATLRAELP